MALPVFVQDADGTPRMPTAPAHARKLLHQGRAARVPHHAFTLIRLAQVIATPPRHSLRLDVAYHTTIAVIRLFLDSSSTQMPLLVVLVVPPPRSWLLRSTRYWAGGRVGHLRRSRSLNRQSFGVGRMLPGPVATRHLPIHQLAEVVVALRTLAPIKVLSWRSSLPAPLKDDERRQLLAHTACNDLTLLEDRTNPMREPGGGLLADAVQGSASLPTIVAWCRPAALSERTQAALIAVTHSGTIAGVVVEQRPLGRIVPASPRLVDGVNVVWRRQMTHRAGVRLRRVPEQVVFLPLVEDLDQRRRHNQR